MRQKVVLITGCSSGIGRALAYEFHRFGYGVIATARRLETLRPLQEAGMLTKELDVTNPDQIRSVFTEIQREEQRLDVLVNNAGYGLFTPLLDVSVDQLAQQFETNLFAPLQLIQAAAPMMRSQQSGLIINIGSISGIMPTPFSGAYASSKAALHCLSDALRMELAPFGIRVMTVQPGAIQSDFGTAARQRTEANLTDQSWYSGIKDTIRARAELSQVDATPTQDFATRLVQAALRPNPPAVLRIGKKSRLLPFLKTVLPRPWLDQILQRRFGLRSIENSTKS
ncbi:MAG: SDR family oxidoreductase [Thainema sp.]